MKKCLDPELHEIRPCDCPGKPKMITDTMRLDMMLQFVNKNPVISCNGRRRWTRRTIDNYIAFIDAERQAKRRTRA